MMYPDIPLDLTGISLRKHSTRFYLIEKQEFRGCFHKLALLNKITAGSKSPISRSRKLQQTLNSKPLNPEP